MRSDPYRVGRFVVTFRGRCPPAIHCHACGVNLHEKMLTTAVGSDSIEVETARANRIFTDIGKAKAITAAARAR